jgi:hypothetical protein
LEITDCFNKCRAISYFTNVLEEGDESVHVAAAEALALIFEIDCLKKFSTLVDCSLCEEDSVS